MNIRFSQYPRSVFALFAVAVFGFVLSACGGGSGGEGATTANDSGSISGQVFVDDGAVTVAMKSTAPTPTALFSFELIESAHAQEIVGEPLAGATVELIDSNGTVVGSTTTDENGDFLFSGIAAGTYLIQVSEPTIVTLVVTDVVVLAGDVAVIEGTVTADGGVASVDYELETCGLVAESPGQLGHAEALASAAEISVDEVIALREGNCLGWGVIAQELEVSPGALGLGNSGVRGGGRPDGVGGGRPENAGPPDGVGGGRPEDAGPPDGRGPQ